MTDMMERTGKRRAPAAVDAGGACVAVAHHSYYSYLYQGCRHPDAVAEHEVRLERQRVQRVVERLRLEREAVIAGRRRYAEPWRGVWRGRDMRVDPVELEMTIAGFRLPVSYGTRVAAVIALDRVRVIDESFRGRELFDHEIAERLGIGDGEGGERQVQRLRYWPVKARRERAQRRLADSRDRAIRIEKARAKDERKETNR